ncbi:MAG: GNAT family protein [Planctomycetota bacterium]
MTAPDSISQPQSTVQNTLGQTVGFPLPDWTPPPFPPRQPLHGRFCRLEPLDPERHTPALYAANGLDTTPRMWTYLPYGPFDTLAQYTEWIQTASKSSDPLFFTVIDLQTDQPVGIVSYLRIDPAIGSIEVGHLAYSPLLQRTPAATESMYLLMKRAFDLGYRRYEWKCDSLNTPSRAAAERLGFTFEGLFRQATIYKQRNRDTAWYSILDREWPALANAFTQWLDPANFDANGNQQTRLSVLIAATR